MFTERQGLDWASTDDIYDSEQRKAIRLVVEALSSRLRHMLDGGIDGPWRAKVADLPFYAAADSSEGGPAAEAVPPARAMLVGLNVEPGKLTALESGLALRHAGIWFLVRIDAQQNTELYALNGTAAPIHQFNFKHGLINCDFVNEYLDFFCTFVTGEEGPFQIVLDQSDLIWAESGVLPQEIKRRRLERNVFGPISGEEDTADAGPKDIGELKERVSLQVRDQLSLRPPNSADARYFANPEEVSKKISASKPRPAGPPAVMRKAMVCYGRSLFHAIFEIQPGGMIKMLFDNVVSDAVRLPLASSRFQSRFGDETFTPSIFVALEPRRDLSDAINNARAYPLSSAIMLLESRGGGRDPASGAVDAPPEATPPDNAAIRARLEFGRVVIRDGVVTEKLDQLGTAFDRPILFENMEFYEDVILSEATFERSLRFVNCVFFGRLVADNVTVHGQLTFERCDFLALAHPSVGAIGKDEIALNLEGAVVDGDLVVSRSDVQGNLSLRGARVAGRGQLLSLSIAPPTRRQQTPPDKAGGSNAPKLRIAQAKDMNLARPAGLDLRDARFGVGLDIGQYHPRPSEDENFGGSRRSPRVRPTIITGPVRGENLRVDGPLCLFGLVTTRFNDNVLANPGENVRGGGWIGIDLGGARISAAIRTWKASDRTAEPWHAAENVIGDTLNLTGAQVEGEVDLRGVWVEKDIILARGRFARSIRLNGMGLGAMHLDAAVLDVVGDECKYDIPRYLLLKSNNDYSIWRNGRGYIGGHLALHGCRIGGNLDLHGLHVVGSIRGDGTIIDGQLNANVYVDVGAYYVDPGNKTVADAPRGNKAAAEASLDKRAYDKNSPQAEYLEKFKESCSFAPLPDDSDASGYRHGLQVTRTSAADIRLRDLTVGGGVDLAGCMIGADSASAASNTDHQAIVIENAKIGGSIRCADWSGDRIIERIMHDNDKYDDIRNTLSSSSSGGPASDREIGDQVCKLLNNQHKRTSLFAHGDIHIRNCSVESEIDLSDLDAKEGRISIRDVKLNGDLRALSSPCEKDETGEERCLKTTAKSLELHLVRCDGDMLLSGLDLSGPLRAQNITVNGDARLVRRGVRAPIGKKCNHKPSAHASAIGETVNGDARLVRRRERAPIGQGRNHKRSAHARAIGEIDLDGSTFSTLSLSGACLEADNNRSKARSWWTRGAQSSPPILRLSRTKVARLHLEGALPQQIDLRSAEITYWDVSEPQAQTLLELLRRMNPYASEAYSSIERALRTQGKRDDAQRVYKMMMGQEAKRARRADRDEIGGGHRSFGQHIGALIRYPWRIAWRGFIWFFYGLLTGYGVGRKRLGFMCVALLATAGALTSAPGNYARPPDDGACAAGAVDAIQLAIPIVALVETVLDRSEEHPLLQKADGPAQLAWGCLVPNRGVADPSIEIPVLSARQASLVIYLLGWLLWPLLLLAMSGYIRRES